LSAIETKPIASQSSSILADDIALKFQDRYKITL